MTDGSWTFCLPGAPATKQRARVLKNGQSYTPRKTKAYEDALGYACIAAMRGRIKPITGPVEMAILAQIPIPESWSQKKKQAAIRGEVFPGHPDIDNYIKIVLDALNQIAYPDDKQVVRVNATKRYSLDPAMIVTVTPCLVFIHYP